MAIQSSLHISPLVHGKPVAENGYVLQKPSKSLRHPYYALKIILNNHGLEARDKTRSYTKAFKEHWVEIEKILEDHALFSGQIEKIQNYEKTTAQFTIWKGIDFYLMACAGNPDAKVLCCFFKKCVSEQKHPRLCLVEHTSNALIKTYTSLFNAIDIKIPLQSEPTSPAKKMHFLSSQFFSCWSQKLGFSAIKWNPKMDHHSLLNYLKKYRFLFAQGYFGKKNYWDEPTETQLSAYTIATWKNGTHKIEALKPHSIVITGMDTKNNNILYVDPENGSDPKHPKQTLYAMEYRFFCEHITPIKDSNSTHSDGKEEQPIAENYLLAYEIENTNTIN